MPDASSGSFKRGAPRPRTSITRENPLRFFTDRYDSIRAFTEAVNEDPAPEQFLLFEGDGGNGKTLLVEFLRTHAAKRITAWADVRDSWGRHGPAEFVRRVQTHGGAALPIAHIDFRRKPDEQPDPVYGYNAVQALRHDLGRWTGPGGLTGYRLRFPVFDFALVYYLATVGAASRERLARIYPAEEVGFVSALFDAFAGSTTGSVLSAGLSLFDRHLKDHATIALFRRKVDAPTVERIGRLHEQGALTDHLQEFLARDLVAALDHEHAPARVVLFFDDLDALIFGRSGTTADDATPGRSDDRAAWLRRLLLSITDPRVVTVLTARRRPAHWAACSDDDFRIADNAFAVHSVDAFTDADADDYLARALAETGPPDPVLRARLLDFARVAPDAVHPLYAGLGADIVLRAHDRGERLSADDFPRTPGVDDAPLILLDHFLLREETEGRMAFAVRGLAAARAFDLDLFGALAKWGREHSADRYASDADAFARLVALSFVWVTGEGETGQYRIHDLLRRALRERGDEKLLEADGVLEAVYRHRAASGYPTALAEAIYHAYQQEPERGLDEWTSTFEEAHEAHLYALCDALREVRATFNCSDPKWQARMDDLEGSYLVERAQYDQAESFLQRALTLREATLGSSDPETLTSVNSLGYLFSQRGDHADAEALYRRALIEREQVLGPNDQDTLTSANNLAYILRTRGDLDNAEPLYERALEGRMATLGPNAPLTCQSLNNLAGLFMARKDYTRAEPLIRHAYSCYEASLGPHDPETLATLDNLAHVLHRTGNSVEAEQLHRLALEGLEHTRGADHPETLKTVFNLGYVTHALGNYEVAKALVRRAADGFEAKFGPDHPTTKAIQRHIAVVLEGRDRSNDPSA